MTSTPPQQYCLRWNNYQNNLTNVFDQLLQSEAFVDVTLSCEGHSLKAHKVVLSACSPYFQSLFFDNPCKHPIVILNGVKWDELKSVVEFMYRGEINVSQEQLAPLLKVAEVLKIRGLADVSRGPNGNVLGGGGSDSCTNSNLLPGGELLSSKRISVNPADFLSNSNHSAEIESPSPHSQIGGTNGHSSSMNANANILSNFHQSRNHQLLTSLKNRKRRKMETPERTPSPRDDDDEDNDNGTGDDHDMDTGDFISGTRSPPSAGGSRRSSPSNGSHHGGNLGLNVTLNPILSSSQAQAMSEIGRVLGVGSNTAGIGPALLNLHAAAAAAAAAGGQGRDGANSSASGGPTGGSGSSVGNDLDIKPGIVEMIREEERAKMLETAHGWLGPSGSTLSDSYQYQIQNLWQKCWNQNQGGMMHALRFRERGPLKSWRPETMAEAIFAVLREGLSLSQAARKYDIPYPTFVLYANRVHNMLGPSADGSSSSDLMSDMRPKGRGRPQRILLGTWPEEHIRGVIRAVVFRDTQSKDEIPFVFNRDGSLMMPQPPANASSSPSSSHNGLDMSLHPHFASNPFLATSPTNNNNTTGGATSSSGGNRATPSSASPSPSAPSTPTLININDTHSSSATAVGQLNSNSPSPQSQQQQLLFQQQRSNLLQLQQRRNSAELSLSMSPALSFLKKGSHNLNLNFSPSSFSTSNNALLSGFLAGQQHSKDVTDKEILQIKAELAPYDDDDDDEGDQYPDEDDDVDNVRRRNSSNKSPNNNTDEFSNKGNDNDEEGRRGSVEAEATIQIGSSVGENSVGEPQIPPEGHIDAKATS